MVHSAKPRFCKANYWVFDFEGNYNSDSIFLLNIKTDQEYSILLKNELENIHLPFLGYNIYLEKENAIYYKKTKYNN